MTCSKKVAESRVRIILSGILLGAILLIAIFLLNPFKLNVFLISTKLSDCRNEITTDPVTASTAPNSTSDADVSLNVVTEMSGSVMNTDEDSNQNPTAFTNETEPLHDLGESSNDSELDRTESSPKPDLTLNASDSSVTEQKTSNGSTLDSNEKLLKPTISPDIEDRDSNGTELVVVRHQDVPESSTSRLDLDPAVIQHTTDPSSSSDFNETSNNTVLDNNGKSLEPVVVPIVTKTTTDAAISPSVVTPVNEVEPKIERGLFQYAIDQTKELVNQSCQDNIAISPIGGLILLSVLGYHASPADKLLFSRKLHLSENDFNLTVGLNGGAAHAIRPFLLEKTKHSPFMENIRLSVNSDEKMGNWTNISETLGVRISKHRRQRIPYYYGEYFHRFVGNWSHFYHRCLNFVNQKFYSGPKQKKTIEFTAMLGDYLVGEIDRLKAKFIVIPYDDFYDEQMTMVFLQPVDETSDIRQFISSKAFHNLTYQDFMSGEKRNVKLLLPPIIVNKCVDWRVKPEFPQNDNSRVNIRPGAYIKITPPEDSRQLCNKIEIDEFGGSVFIINRPSVMFLMWKRMILLSAIIDSPSWDIERLEVDEFSI